MPTGGGLDFVIFAPGRSGTTAFGDALNLHPNVFCGTEFFTLTSDHAGIVTPGTFLGPVPPPEEHAHRLTRNNLTDRLRRNEPITIWGNKTPKYFYILDRLANLPSEPKLLFIYRQPGEFVFSWDKRAEDPSDQWPRGQVGIFGIIEMMFCLLRVTSTPAPVHIFDYRKIFFDDPQAIRSAFTVINADPARFDDAKFQSEYFRQRSGQNRSDPVYDHILGRLNFDEVSGIIHDAGVLTNQAPGLDKAVAALMERFDKARGDIIDALLQSHLLAQDYAHFLSGGFITASVDDAENAGCQWFQAYTKAIASRVQRVIPGSALAAKLR